MAEQRAGADFLLRRLQRAAAIPAAERPPDVAAFVESVQLLREAFDLLPLTSDGRPALQLDSSKARQQAELALFKAARADYICPADPVSDREVRRHLRAYCSRGLADCSDLLVLLLRYTFLQHNWKASIDQVISTAAAVLDQLAASAQHQAISRQLAQLAAAYPGQPLLSFNQVHHACCCAALRAVQIVVTPTAPHQQAQSVEPNTAQARSAASILSRAADTMLSLEPRNPKSYDVAAAAAAMAVSAPRTVDTLAQQMQRGAQLALQGAQLARQQGNVFLAAHCGAGAVLHASYFAQTQRANWQAAIAEFQGADAAVRACKAVLPAYWVGNLENLVQIAVQNIQVVQRQLHSPHSAGSLGVHLAALAGITVSAAANMHRPTTCDGCGRPAAGLRRCARCKTAHYCSMECQHKHWRTHKRECHEA